MKNPPSGAVPATAAVKKSAEVIMGSMWTHGMNRDRIQVPDDNIRSRINPF